VKTWINTFFKDKYHTGDDYELLLEEELKDHLWAMFNDTIDRGLEYIRDRFKEPIKTTDL